MEPPRQTTRTLVALLIWSERIVFFLIGALMFIAALGLVWRAATTVTEVFSPSTSIITAGSSFLDIILLTLMVVELAYTVMLSLRGEVLSAEPFLIVGLIAVIRRILVITVGEVNTARSGDRELIIFELLTLMGVVIAFVFSIYLLRRRQVTKRPLRPQRQRDEIPIDE